MLLQNFKISFRSFTGIRATHLIKPAKRLNFPPLLFLAVELKASSQGCPLLTSGIVAVT